MKSNKTPTLNTIDELTEKAFPSPSRFHRLKKILKFWFQRRIRGWDDSCTWNLDTSLSSLILPRLKRFKVLTNGWPDNHFKTMEEWEEAIDKMIYSFTFYSEEKQYDCYDTKEWEKVQEGLDLFGKCFSSLWW